MNEYEVILASIPTLEYLVKEWYELTLLSLITATSRSEMVDDNDDMNEELTFVLYSEVVIASTLSPE